jgi:predicted phage tail protein
MWMSIICSLLISFTSQAIAVKWHWKRGRLKTDTEANDSMGASVQESRTTRDAFAFHAELWIADCSGTSFMTMAVALLVAAIAVTALVPTALAIQAGDSDAILSHTGPRYISSVGNVFRIWM